MIVEGVRPIHVEIVGRVQHVGGIERCVRTFKEGFRCTTSNLNDTYKRMPRVTIDAIVEDKIHWLNNFLSTYYRHPHTVPAGLMLGTGTPNVKHLQLDFGQNCQVYENTKNDMTFRSVGAITFRPKNEMGSYYFMSLRSGRRIHSNQWTVLHVTE